MKLFKYTDIILSSALIIAFGIAELLTFVGIWAWGEITIIEPTIWIRVMETILSAGIIVYGMARLVKFKI